MFNKSKPVSLTNHLFNHVTAPNMSMDDMYAACRRIMTACSIQWPDKDNLIHGDISGLTDYFTYRVESSTDIERTPIYQRYMEVDGWQDCSKDDYVNHPEWSSTRIVYLAPVIDQTKRIAELEEQLSMLTQVCEARQAKIERIKLFMNTYF